MTLPAPDVDAVAIAAAKSKVGAGAQATLDAVRHLSQRAVTLLSAPSVLRASARQQTDILNTDAVVARLREKPVTALKDVAGRGVRLNQLERAGFRTVADVLHAPVHALHAVSGVGPQTVQQAVDAARLAAVQVHRDTRFRFDPDRRDPGQTQLLATLAAIRAADSTAASLGQPLQVFTTQTAPLVVEAERAASRFKMLLPGREKKNAALRALAQLDAILADPRIRSLQEAVAQREQAVDPNAYHAAQLWQDYATDAASVNAVLSTVGALPDLDDGEAARGFIPEELRQQINAIPLDTSLLTATLRGYQVFGAQYAIHQERSILGDEMGLGKTVQALAVFAHLTAKGQRRFLVVCPASVQINWLNETAKHSRLVAHSLHGADRDRVVRRWLREGGVAVTTFSTLARLPAEVRTAGVAMLVVDEAHYIKNPDAARSKAVVTVVGEAQRVLFLTGTPMENRVEEFRNLVGYSNRGSPRVLMPRTRWPVQEPSGVPWRRSTCAATRRTCSPSCPRRSRSRTGSSSPRRTPPPTRPRCGRET